jgi:hypothetical protein
MKPADLSPAQRTLALQRLTALWAFSESGLGGVLHALQIPFTGLLVGGFAIILITLIAHLSNNSYGELLKSLAVVLLVKAAVSPHTPLPAYLAVSFQAFLGYGLFRVFGVRVYSVMVLSVLAMFESALQKLVVLTVFFGSSFWRAVNELVLAVSKQLWRPVATGSRWLIATYLAIYVLGGVLVGLTALRMVRDLSVRDEAFSGPLPTPVVSGTRSRRSTGARIRILLTVCFLLSLILFLTAADRKEGFLATARAVTWTVSAILLWFLLLAPLVTKFIRKKLHKREGRYRDEVGAVIAFLPVLRQLAVLAWRASRRTPGWRRVADFLTLLITWSLTYSEPAPR